MALVTLLTDFGMTDSYVAEVKGVILSLAPATTLVDVGHLVAPGDIRSGALGHSRCDRVMNRRSPVCRQGMYARFR